MCSLCFLVKFPACTLRNIPLSWTTWVREITHLKKKKCLNHNGREEKRKEGREEIKRGHKRKKRRGQRKEEGLKSPQSCLKSRQKIYLHLTNRNAWILANCVAVVFVFHGDVHQQTAALWFEHPVAVKLSYNLRTLT